MEITNKASSQRTHTATTRVYSPTRGSSAFAYAQTAQAQTAQAQTAQAQTVPQPQRSRPQTRPQTKPQTQAKPKTQRQVSAQLSTGTRISLVLGILVLSVTTLFVIFRYHDISRQWAVVNQLNASIEAAQLRIAELNVLVTLECAVDIQQAQESAARFGITYPEARQYVRAGDALIADSSAEDAADEPG